LNSYERCTFTSLHDNMELMINTRDYSVVPEQTILELRKYAFCRIPPSGSIRRVLENDLQGSLAALDEKNRSVLFAIAAYIFCELPSSCSGSADNVSNWLKTPGISLSSFEIRELLLFNSKAA
jgi:hypothetical protein